MVMNRDDKERPHLIEPYKLDPQSWRIIYHQREEDYDLKVQGAAVLRPATVATTLYTLDYLYRPSASQ